MNDASADIRPRATMADVARAAGVHPSTVSRALRNDPVLPGATRERVHEAARQLNYHPHPLVAALMSSRRRRVPVGFNTTVAYVRFTAPPGHTTTSMQLYEQGARLALEQQDFQIAPFTLGADDMHPKRLNAILRARRIPGLIIGALPAAEGHFELDWEDLCTVVIEFTFSRPEFDRVVHDGFAGMQLALEKCHGRGLHRVGLAISRTAHERTRHSITSAFWMDAAGGGFSGTIPPLISDGWDREAFEAWIASHEPGVIVLTNEFLPRVREWLVEHRLQPQHDIGLVNLNTTQGGDVTGVFQNSAYIGTLAARLVMEKIARNDRGVPTIRQTVLIPGYWNEGATLGHA
jgi:DNA-binding LacI/PurR family transcriptional regulator